MNTRPPTQRQLQILAIFCDSRVPPTYRELAEELDLSGLNGVRDHLVRLEAKGLLEQTMPNRSRSWSITKAGRAAVAAAKEDDDAASN